MNKQEIMETYKKLPFEYVETTEEVAEMKFNLSARDPTKIAHRVSQVYRVRKGNNTKREFILYNDLKIVEDNIGNRKTLPVLEGKHEEPILEYELDESNVKQVKAIRGKKWVYDIPYSRENMIKVLSINDPDDEEEIDQSFVLDAGFQKFGGFSAEEFVNKSFDELLIKAQTGKYPKKDEPMDEPLKDVTDEVIAEKRLAKKLTPAQLRKQEQNRKNVEKYEKEVSNDIQKAGPEEQFEEPINDSVEQEKQPT